MVSWKPSMPRSNRAAATVVSFMAAVAQASSPAPLVLATGEWLGNDGNWSTVNFKVGTDQQSINALVSTSLSEFWTVGAYGCDSDDNKCSKARGGIYVPETSESWDSLGIWELGLSWLGFEANGDYGLDKISAHDSVTDVVFNMEDVIISAVNTTDYFIGMFGLGLTQSSFGDTVADCPLSQAVKDYGLIPSYSYGYTAGAHYHNMPMSATLGGHDASRFAPHQTKFTLTSVDNIPRTLVRGIEVTTGDSADAPETWDSDVEVLSDWDSSFIAMIDSSTPFLWLPEAVCDSFADALNLTYDEEFDLYTTTGDKYQQLIKEDAFSFKFSLSSFDNTDELGDVLGAQGVVNITISSRAFASTLRYPFGDGAIAYGDPAVPYFSLRKSLDSTFIIGRSFLQESYLVTQNDDGVFSIHEALFSENNDIVAIAQSDSSPYPPPYQEESSNRLSTAQMVGIAVGVVSAASIAAALVIWYFWRRNKRLAHEDAVAVIGQQHKGSTSSLATEMPGTPLSRILSRLSRRNPSSVGPEKPGSSSQPAEAPDSAIYELPAPPPPVELAGGDDHSISGDTDFGCVGTYQESSTYERAKRKVDRQLRGPVPEYSPPVEGFMPPTEKELIRVEVEVPRRVEQPSPVSPAVRSDRRSNSYKSLPSPLSPLEDARNELSRGSTAISSFAPRLPLSIITDKQSSAAPTEVGQQHRDRLGAVSRSNSEKSVSPLSATSLQLPLHGTSQRTPIDPSKVICLGTLHEDSLSSDFGVLDLPDFGMKSGPYSGMTHHSTQSVESLGSNFTEDEERMVAEMTRQPNLPPSQPTLQHQSTFGAHWEPPAETHTTMQEPWHTTGSSSPGMPRNRERIDPGIDLVHVPQVAHQRYSWEV